MQTERMTVAQVLIGFLDQQHVNVNGKETPFVEGVTAILGHGSVPGIGQALEQDPGYLQVMQGYNEQGIAHMATRFAKQYHHQRTSAITSSAGSGTASMVAAAATATANRVPLLLLLGDIYACRQPNPVSQQVEQHHDLSIGTNDCFCPISRYWDHISRPEQLMNAMLSTIRALTGPANAGTMTIRLPQDIRGEARDCPLSFFAHRVHYTGHRPPNPQRLTQAHALISRKRHPLAVCGDGVRYFDTYGALQESVEMLQLPFIETQAGKGVLVSDYPPGLDGVGVTGGMAASQSAPQADLAIDIGTCLADFTTGSRVPFSHPSAEFLLLNVAESDSLKLDATVLIADARTGLIALTHTLKGYRSGWGEMIAHAKSAWHDECCRLWKRQWHPDDVPEVAGHLDAQLTEYSETLNTHPTRMWVSGLINQHIEDNAILVGAAGSLPGDLQRLWQVKTPDSYHPKYGYSCVGYGITAAIGAKLVKLQQSVYAMVDNGSYMVSHSELQTAIQEGIKVTILLFDNANFSCINNLQIGHGVGSFGTENRYRNPKTDQLSGPLVKADFA